MRHQSGLMAAFGVVLATVTLWAQAPQAPWRGAGPQPCMGTDGGVYQCPPAPRVVAVRAGRLFDSKSGQMLTRQVVLLMGERITAVGPEAQVKIPAGAQVVDLSQATVLPGLIDAHTHMFNQRGPKHDHGSRDAHRRPERASRSAGRRHDGARHELPRQRIRRHRDPQRHQRGPHRRPPVSSVDAGHRLGRHAGDRPRQPLASTVVRSVDEARAAVRDQIGHGADWIKLFPTGGYSFTPTGEAQYVLDLSPAGSAGVD